MKQSHRLTSQNITQKRTGNVMPGKQLLILVYCLAWTLHTARPRPKRKGAAKIYTLATVQNAEIAHSTLIFTAVMQNHVDGRKSRHTTKITVPVIVVIMNTWLSYSLLSYDPKIFFWKVGICKNTLGGDMHSQKLLLHVVNKVLRGWL